MEDRVCPLANGSLPRTASAGSGVTFAVFPFLRVLSSTDEQSLHRQGQSSNLLTFFPFSLIQFDWGNPRRVPYSPTNTRHLPSHAARARSSAVSCLACLEPASRLPSVSLPTGKPLHCPALTMETR